MSCHVIRADEVQPGDRIWNSGRDVHPAFRWVNVVCVEPMKVACRLEDQRIVHLPGVRIVTGAWETHKTAGVGITVMRI
jgi:hypothetical protein